MARRVVVICTLLLLAAAGTNAQSVISGTSAAPNQPAAQAQSSTSTDSTAAEATRPATTTFLGDTGLWFVPTAEVIKHGKWSASGYRRGTNFIQGFANVGDFAGTFSVGIKDRAEIFGSFLFDTRVERDLRPIFTSDRTVGGILDRYPHANSGWSGDNAGDLYLGAKINFLSQYRQKPLAVAFRAIVKAPTGDIDNGVSTGKLDTLLDLIVSRETAKHVEVSAYGGYEIRGQPDGIDASSGALRWGVGAAFPSRSPLRGVFELNGSMPNSDTATITGASIFGVDSSVAPLASDIEKLTRTTAALTWQSRKGFFIGGGISWNLPMKDRAPFNTDEGAFGDYVDWQVRIGFHPGTAIYVPPPPPPPRRHHRRRHHRRIVRHGHRPVRSVHGRGRKDSDRHGDRGRSGR